METVETVETMETMETVKTISILVRVHSHKDWLECRPVSLSACQHVGT